MKHARFAALVLATVVLAGCASVKKTTEGWWGEVSGGSAGQPEELVYYAASGGLPVHQDASGGSSIVGRLTLHERVVRTDLRSGWAYVTSDSGLTGWVDNAQLIWRLPTSGATPATTTAPAASGPETAAPATAEPAAPAPPEAVPPADAAPAEAAPAEPAPQPAAAPAVEPPPAPSPAPAPASQPARGNQPSPDMFDPF